MLGFFVARFGHDSFMTTKGSKVFTRLDQGVVRFSVFAEQSLELRWNARVRMGEK